VESRARPIRRKGCLLFVVIMFLLLLATALYAAWKLRIIKIGDMEPISPAAAALRQAPVDPAASQALNQALAKSGVKGASAAVASLGEKGGNAALIVVDTGGGFVPPAGTEGKRKLARAVIRELVQSNGAGDLERVGFEYQENGKPLVALTAPMSALKELDGGKITEAQFLARVDVKVQDAEVFKELLAKFR